MRPVFLLLVVALCAPLAQTWAQSGRPEARRVQTQFRISWKAQPGVKRYRLQVARDTQFTDIVLDRIVFGTEYNVTELPGGSYYWRVAPAADETGLYSEPAPVQINEAGGGAGTQTTTTTGGGGGGSSTAVAASDNTGWRTATGNVMQPIAAPLRSSASMDLVGVNDDGMVYGLDGANGVALWTARFRPRAKRGEPTGNSGALPFTPVIINTAKGTANVLVAFEGGVRALEGGTGRELWKATVPGRAASGISADLMGDAKPEVFIVSDGTPTLTVLDGETGKMVSQSKLDATALGAPALYRTQSIRGVVLAFEGGLIEVRSGSAERVLSIKLDAAMTTPALFVQAAPAPVVLVGTERGLIALNANDLKPLWRVATDEDAPRGVLNAADLDGDGLQDAVMVTRRGRTVAVNTANGKIMWYAPGANDAYGAAFADLDGDGSSDVLVAAGPAFAVGYSGRSGAMIWKAEDENRRAAASSEPKTRALVTAPVSSGAGSYVIGSDPARTGLRAIGLPRGAVKVASQ